MSLVDSIGRKASAARWLGVLLIVLGMLALVMPWTAGLSVALTIGSLLLASGLTQLGLAFRGPPGETIGLVILGLLAILCGGYMLFQPGVALGALTLLVAGLFFAQGLIEIFNAFGSRPETGWGWLLASGVASVLLGGMIWRQLPFSGAWAIGVLVGLRLLISGTSVLAIASAVKGATQRVADMRDA